MSQLKKLMRTVPKHLQRDAILTIYVMGMADELVKMGLLNEGRIKITELGKDLFREIQEDPTFEPTDAELEKIIMQLKQNQAVEVPESMRYDN